MTSEQNPEGEEGVRHENTKRKTILNWGNSKCKSPEAGPCLECFRNGKETSRVGQGGEGAKARQVTETVHEGPWRPL